MTITKEDIAPLILLLSGFALFFWANIYEYIFLLALAALVGVFVAQLNDND